MQKGDESIKLEREDEDILDRIMEELKTNPPPPRSRPFLRRRERRHAESDSVLQEQTDAGAGQ